MKLIDYSQYSIDELIEVKGNIDPKSENYESLLKELANRKEEVTTHQVKEKEKELNIAEKRVQIIGYFQVIAAVAITAIYFLSVFDGTASLLSTLITLVLVALNIVAGITAIKEKYKYYWVSIFNQALQVPNIAIGTISAKYSGLGGAYVSINLAPQVSLGVDASLSPGFALYQYTAPMQSQFIAIDILAIIFLGALITVSEVKGTTDTNEPPIEQ
ncbi:hypothetical protein A9267_20710 [Shewanella sp. UCD-FRSSP16_17]|uniref:hypothetical protein n=1 Tax=Shewanella sp. UCD-FRSSP16_17 TaxID=1853256 RepID=UPI0007EED4B7|nr:hypothetical protein [Shewanella sp. UCD-FRSSP16_17]OBT09572.1 hypothetical protein A9267_20710 [Shewanella sp. UCD-FRSSP16_17]